VKCVIVYFLLLSIGLGWCFLYLYFCLLRFNWRIWCVLCVRLDVQCNFRSCWKLASLTNRNSAALLIKSILFLEILQTCRRKKIKKCEKLARCITNAWQSTYMVMKLCQIFMSWTNNTTMLIFQIPIHVWTLIHVVFILFSKHNPSLISLNCWTEFWCIWFKVDCKQLCLCLRSCLWKVLYTVHNLWICYCILILTRLFQLCGSHLLQMVVLLGFLWEIRYSRLILFRDV